MNKLIQFLVGVAVAMMVAAGIGLNVLIGLALIKFIWGWPYGML